jgi:lysine-arginine-ornithine-binding protein
MRGKSVLKVVTLLMVAGLALAVLLPGCGSNDDSTTAKVTTLVKGTLSMGSDTTYRPFEFSDSGEIVGFDVDLATEICSRLGLTLQVDSVAWDGIIPGLKTDKYDILMSAMTITPERSAEIDFTTPYYDSAQSIAVQESNNDIKTEADLAGKNVGVQLDTTGQELAESIEGIKEIFKYETIAAAFEDLKLGRIDAIVNDYPVNAYIAKTQGGTKVVKEIKTDEQYGIGVKQGNTQLLDAINQALADIKADGTYDTIYTKWFGKKK